MSPSDFPGTVLADPDCSESCPVEFPIYYGGKTNLDVFAERQADDKEESGMRSYTMLKSKDT